MADKTCLIISGGEFDPCPDLPASADLVIACDRGWQYAERLGLRPHVILGDFDSSPRPPEGSAPILTFPVHKDDTDTMLAIRHALEQGCRHLTLCCALGRRQDHALANLQSAAFAAERGARCRILASDTVMDVFSSGSLSLPRREGWSLSVFALSDRCEGVTLRGTEYPCENQTLTAAFPLGVSNAWAAEEASVSLEKGILAVMQCRLV